MRILIVVFLSIPLSVCSGISADYAKPMESSVAKPEKATAFDCQMTEFVQIFKGKEPIYPILETFSMLVMPETTEPNTQVVTFYKTNFLSGITTRIDDYSRIDVWSWNTGTIHMTFRIVLESIKFDTSEPRYEAIYSYHDPDPVNGDPPNLITFLASCKKAVRQP